MQESLSLGAGARVSARATLDVSASARLDLAASAQARLVTALSAWLSARWLPAPAWHPDPAWLDIDIPTPPIPAVSFSVISGLVQAQLACQAELGLDVSLAVQLAMLARVVTTLNLRLPDLQVMLDAGTAVGIAAEPEADWQALATLNDQVDIVAKATAQGVFAAQADAALAAEPDVPLGPWRPFLAKVKAIVPLIAILRSLGIDPADPQASVLLAARLRLLATVTLPAIAEPAVVFGLIARLHATLRLQASLKLDPRTVPFARVQLAVQARLQAAITALPPTVQLVAGEVIGVRARSPNPAILLTPDVMAQIQLLRPQVVAQFNWSVPGFHQLALLTTAAPVVKLVSQLKLLGVDPIRTAPCGPACDAGALRRPSAAVTGSPGNGTGAAPAG